MCTLCVCVQLLSHIRLFVISWTEATKLLCPWNFPGKNSGVSCHFILQRTFLTEELNLHLLHHLHWQADSLPLYDLGSLHVIILNH